MRIGYRYSSVGIRPSTAMPNHVVQMPTGFIALRIIQLIFALVVLGLSGFLISQTSGGIFSAEAFATFAAAVTLIALTYKLVAEKAAHGAYNMWAFLSLDIVGFLFWVSAAGSLGALRAAFMVPVDVTTCTYGIDPDTGDCITYRKRALFKRDAWAGDVYLDIVVADAAISGVQAYVLQRYSQPNRMLTFLKATLPHFPHSLLHSPPPPPKAALSKFLHGPQREQRPIRERRRVRCRALCREDGDGRHACWPRRRTPTNPPAIIRNAPCLH